MIRTPLSQGRMLESLYDRLRSSQPRLMARSRNPVPLPASLQGFLARLHEDLGKGGSVTILHETSELSTSDAAKLLSVSRQFFVNLLESGKIPFHLTGSHRRVYTRDVLRFKAHRDSERRKALDELARTELSEGLYDRVPMNGDVSPG